VMHYFVDASNNVFAFDEASDAPADLSAIGEAEALALAAASAPARDLPAAIAEERYKQETAGIILNGMAIDTGRDSQALITGATLSAIIDPEYVCTWKTVNGPVQLTAPMLIGVASAVRAHVQACFDREGDLLSAVADETFVDSMLYEGWPE
jgi:hypothetical protein